MHTLEPSRYDKVRPLFEPLSHHLAVTAILDGDAPGAVYVDDPAQPRVAFARTGHRFFLAGSARQAAFNQQLTVLLTGTVFPEALDRGLPIIEFKVAEDEWREPLATALSGVTENELILGQRQYYRFQALRHDWRTLLPAGFELEFITPKLLARTDLAYLDELREELCSERPSVEDFLARSFGVVAICVADAALAGWCTSEYNRGERCEVGIGTLEPYQRRGLATAMGSAFVEHAGSRGVTRIGWHCWARNLASVATALAIGYQKFCDHTTCVVDLRRRAGP